jgi:hypothetical protein
MRERTFATSVDWQLGFATANQKTKPLISSGVQTAQVPGAVARHLLRLG